MNVQTRKILRDLWVNKARSLLIILAVAIGVAAFGLMISGRIVLEENLRDVYAASAPAHSVLVTASFDEKVLAEVRANPDVAAARAWRVDLARIQAGPGNWLSFQVHTLPNFSTIELNKLGPQANPPTPAAGSILLERSLQNIMQVGDTVTIELLDGESHTLQVAGFVNDLSALPSEISLTGLGYITPATADRLGLPETYNQLAVQFTHAETRAEIEQQLTRLVAGLEDQGTPVFRAPVPEPGQYVLGGNMTSVLFLLNALGALTLLLSAFLVTSVMSAVMSQQIPQIGILKSLGARMHQTLWLYFRQVLLFGLVALALAIPMGLVGAYFLADGVAAGMNFNVPRFYLPVETLLLQAASALLAPLLAALFPILAGSRITIREAISNISPETNASAARLGDLPQIANLSIRNTFRRTGRLALTFAALLMAGSMFIAILGIRQSMRQAVSELQGDLNYDVGIDLARPYPISELEDPVRQASQVRATEAWAVENARLVFNENHLSGSIVLHGIPQNSGMARPAVIQGQWLSTQTERGIFVNADLLDLSPNLGVGSTITLNINGRESEWTILGSGGRGFIPMAFVLYEDLVEETGREGFANRLVLATEQSAPVAQSAAQSDVLSHLAEAGITVSGAQTTTQLKETSAAQMDILIILLLAMVVLIAVVGGLGLAITMSLNVLERTREIGILRSLGAQNGVVRRMVILEALVIGLLGWAVSIPCSIPLAIFLGNALGNSLLARPLDYIFSVPAALGWLGLTVLIALLASLAPAQTAAKLTIRDALVYE